MASRKTRAWLETRVQILEGELAASRRTVDALVRRVERRETPGTRDQFAVFQAMAALEEAVEARTRELAASEQHFRTLYHNSPDPLLTVADGGRILARNAAARSLGLASSLQEIFEQPDAIQVLIERRFAGAAEREMRLRDGRRVLLTVAEMRDSPDGEPIHYVSLKDITALRALEESLEHNRRLVALGRLIFGVANELNNPLAVILGRLELLEALGDVDAAVRTRHLDVVKDHAVRISEFVGLLEVSAQPNVGVQEASALSVLLDRAARLYSARLGRLRIHKQLPEEELMIWGVAEQISGAIAILVGALTDEMRARGQLEFSAFRVGSTCRLELRSPGRSVGFADMFEGERARGRLALELIDLLLRGNGGDIQALEKRDGVALLLTLAEETSSLRDGREASTVALRVLVVEDQPTIAELIGEILSAEGHQFFCACDVGEAREILEAHAEEIDVVLCDLILHGDSGLTFREELGRRWPLLTPGFILMSGQPDVSLLSELYLRKPFTRRQLLEVLSESIEVRDQTSRSSTSRAPSIM